MQPYPATGAAGVAGDVTAAINLGSAIRVPSTPIATDWTATVVSGGNEYMAITVRDSTVDIWLENREAILRNSAVAHASIADTGGAFSIGVPGAFFGACLASSAWTDTPADGMAQRSYVTLVHPTPLNSVFLTVRDDGLCVARTIPGNAGDPQTTHRLPRVSDGDGDRRYQWCAVYKSKIDALDEGVFTEPGPRLITLDFAADDAYQAVTVGRSLYLGGACPMVYDGLSWVEAGFHYAPDWEAGATLHTAANSTGTIANGTYNYIFWYEATLATGEIIRGPTSKPYTVTLAGAVDTVTIDVPTLRLSEWGREGGPRENLRLCAARTINGDAALYYRITSLDPATAGDVNGYVVNTQQADTVEVIDGMPDATLLGQEPVYTTGNIPPNDPVPGSVVVAEAKGRLWMADPSDDSAVYYSQELADGYAVEMTPELRVITPAAGGAITAIASLDSAVILFKRGAIYGVSGDGPLADPSQGGFSNPAHITSDVGCIDQRTVVTTPNGLMFKSAKGIYMLDRGLQVSYIGAAVEAFNSLTIVRATLVDDTTQVRFLTSDGVCLVYDYLFGQWSTFTNHSGTASCIVDGVYHYLRTDGRVFKEAPGTYLDDNQRIRMVIDTAWMSLLDHLQGLQRLYHLLVLGDRRSAHDLRVSYQVDFEDQWFGPFEMDSSVPGGTTFGEGTFGSGVYSGTPAGAYQWRIHLGLVCEDVRFRFEDYEEAGDSGASFVLTELLLTGGVKSGANRPFAADRSA